MPRDGDNFGDRDITAAERFAAERLSLTLDVTRDIVLRELQRPATSPKTLFLQDELKDALDAIERMKVELERRPEGALLAELAMVVTHKRLGVDALIGRHRDELSRSAARLPKRKRTQAADEVHKAIISAGSDLKTKYPHLRNSRQIARSIMKHGKNHGLSQERVRQIIGDEARLRAQDSTSR